jgi:hypothetical protein
LLGAAAGGSLGYVAAGVTGAAVGAVVGSVAGLGYSAAIYSWNRPVVLAPIPFPHAYGYFGPPPAYAGPTLYYSPAF